MHPADPPGRQDVDPGTVGGPHRRRDGGRAKATRCHDHRQVPPGDLARLTRHRQAREVSVGNSDPDLTAFHGYPCGHGPRRADGAGQGLGHLLREPDRASHPALGHRSGPAATRAPAAHAARRASPGDAPVARAARNTPSKASPAPVGSASTTGSPSYRMSRPSHDIAAPRGPRLTHTTGYRRARVSAASSPRRPHSTSASSSFTNRTDADSVAAKKRVVPNSRRSGQEAASTATYRAFARFSAALAAGNDASSSRR